MMNSKFENRCKYSDENGVCEIAGIACEKVFICSDDAVYIDKEDCDEN